MTSAQKKTTRARKQAEKAPEPVEEAQVAATEEVAPTTAPAQPDTPPSRPASCVNCGNRAIYETDGRSTTKRAYCQRCLPANVTTAMVEQYQRLSRQ